MPIAKGFKLPGAAGQLTIPDSGKLFVVFVASTLPETGQSWCPDVRAAMPVLEAEFSGEDKPELKIVEVGQVPEWRKPDNVYRTKWSVNSVPTLARFEQVDGDIKETGRLVEGELLDSKAFKKFVS
ncbi:hypothetical protein PspLS_02965 [Pyricularia sp. CBS 133598]|nr:hypothetical protein PspLS_02965 [Pyricularia sp. CBS 133598]